MKQLVLAGVHFAETNGDLMPSVWQQFTNGMPVPSILYCPADAAHPKQTNWGSVNFSAISYQILAPGVPTANASTVFIQCSVHQNSVLVDGTAQEAKPYEKHFPANYNGALAGFSPTFYIGLEGALAGLCFSQCYQIGFAGSIYADDHGGLFPTSFGQMTNELDGLGSPKLFFCPADVTNTVPASFAQVNYSAVSYQLVSPGVPRDPVRVFARCPIHGNYVDTHGAGIQGTNRYPPRLIVGHPFSQTVEPGGTVTLSVLVGSDPGLAPIRFQWRRRQPFDAAGNPFTNTISISGATNRTFVITNAQSTNEGYYDVVVRDATGGYQEGYMAYLRVEPLAQIKSTFAWEPLSCIWNLKNIGLACHWYANAHSDVFPTDFAAVSAFSGWPLILYCPNDTSKLPPDSWPLVNFNDTSYSLRTNVLTSETTNVLAVCKTHGFYVTADGSVYPYPFQPPQITSQPASVVVIAGNTAVFSVSATGTNLLFQWRKNGMNLNGATSPTLTLNGVTTNQAGQYSVAVSNSLGRVTSQGAALTIGVPPSISVQPQSQTVNPGTNVTFTVTANGTPLFYHWRFNAVNRAGTTNSALTLTNVQLAQAGSYSVIVSNPVGAVTSQVAVLTVRVPPSISSQPQNQTVNAGATATFNVSASGTAPLYYQWRFGGTNKVGATNATLSLTNVQSTAAGGYSVLVSNLAGTVTSLVVSLTVRVRPAIQTQPASKLVGSGASVSFSVAASGTVPLAYQWQFNGANRAGATNPSLILSNVVPVQAGNYSVIVSNMAGVTNSSLAALSLFGARRSGSNAELTIWGPTGRTYRVDYVNMLSNSQTWALLTNISPATNFGVVTDPAPRTQRFYRSALLP